MQRDVRPQRKRSGRAEEEEEREKAEEEVIEERKKGEARDPGATWHDVSGVRGQKPHLITTHSPVFLHRRKGEGKKRRQGSSSWQLFRRRISTFSSVCVHMPQPDELQRRGRSGRAELADGSPVAMARSLALPLCVGFSIAVTTAGVIIQVPQKNLAEEEEVVEDVKTWDCNKRSQTSSSSPHLPLFTCPRTHANMFNDLSHPLLPLSSAHTSTRRAHVIAPAPSDTLTNVMCM